MSLLTQKTPHVDCLPLELPPFEQMQQEWTPFLLLAARMVDLDCWQAVITTASVSVSAGLDTGSGREIPWLTRIAPEQGTLSIPGIGIPR